MSSLFEMSDQERRSAAIMNRLNKSLIKAIYLASKAHGISQTEIAERLEVNKSVVSRILQGRGNPTFRTVSDICSAIGIEPDFTFVQAKLGRNTGIPVAGTASDQYSTSQPLSHQRHSYSLSKKPGRHQVSSNV